MRVKVFEKCKYPTTKIDAHPCLRKCKTTNSTANDILAPFFSLSSSTSSLQLSEVFEEVRTGFPRDTSDESLPA